MNTQERKKKKKRKKEEKKKKKKKKKKGGGFMGVGIWKNKAGNEGRAIKKGIILNFFRR